jgi:photosystem II stability/assembly factor-like uncharacterized protein
MRRHCLSLRLLSALGFLGGLGASALGPVSLAAAPTGSLDAPALPRTPETPWRWVLPAPTGANLLAACSAGRDLWVAGDYGLFGRLGASDLDEAPVATTASLGAVACCPGGVLAAGERGAVVWRAGDGSVREWGLVGPDGAAPLLTGAACLPHGEVAVAGADGGLWVGNPAAELARRLAPHPIYGLFASGAALLAGGPRGAIARTIDGGLTWQAVGLPPGSDDSPTGNVVAFAGEGRQVVAVGGRGLFVRSGDHGARFSPALSGTTEDLSAVVWGGMRAVHALARGRFVHWLSVPEREPVGLDGQFLELVRHRGRFLALGLHGRVASRPVSDSPEGWDEQRGSRLRLFDSWTNGRVQVVVGDFGQILRRGWGQRFARTPNPTGGDIYAVTGNRHGVVLAVGDGGGVARSSDGGRSWSARSMDEKFPLVAVWLDDAGRAVAVGQGGLRFWSQDGGLSWRSERLSKDVELTGVVQLGRRLWITGAKGFLEFSDDFGRSWYSAAAPAVDTDLRTPLGTSGGSLIATSFSGDVHRRDSGGAWTTQRLCEGSRPSGIAEVNGEVVIVTTDGRVFASRDDGRGFIEARGPGRVQFNSVFAAPDGRLWATGLDGMLLVRDVPKGMAAPLMLPGLE